MHVVATAGHVDHGKSTLVRALTGMEPDRWAEEQRRGMTIDLGFAWTDLPGGEVVGFVDVPGHQRFLGNMLAGLGPSPAVLFVVAADEGWGRQSAEHLAAIDGLGVEHGLLAVTRSDLADPAAALEQARREIAATSLGDIPAITVSGTTGHGLDELRQALQVLVADLPEPDTEGPVRLWVDRVFTIHGAGTVVTGTLTSGGLAVGDDVQLPHGTAVIRGLESRGEQQHQVTATARVAVNLRGVDRRELSRGDTLLTGRWPLTSTVDVRLTSEKLPERLVLHVGTAAVPVRVRALGAGAARLHLPAPLPLRVGDRALLRDPAGQRVLTGVTVLDTDPPSLARRGDAARRAAQLQSSTGSPDPLIELGRRGAVPADELTGLTGQARTVDGWVVDESAWQRWTAALNAAVDERAKQQPLDPALPDAAAARATGVPTQLLSALADAAGLMRMRGRISRPGVTPDLGPAEAAMVVVEKRLQDDPFDAPTTKELESLGLTSKHLAAAQTAGRLLLLEGVVVLPSAVDAAVRKLASAPQPFTVVEARQAMGASRPVAVALLERLDQLGHTKRLVGGVRLLSAPR